jgi:hypothetical protein
VTDRSEVLLIGGRSGVGKSTVGAEVSVQLAAAEEWHALVEGDNLGWAYPPAWEHGLAERNLAAMWGNYRALGYRRLVYTNTVSVGVASELTAAMGDDPRVMGVLLTARDDTARGRLANREIGTALDWHVTRSARAAVELEAAAPDWVVRVPTDGRTVPDIAREVVALTGW